MKEFKSKETVFNYRQIYFVFWFLLAWAIFIFVDEGVISFLVALPLMIILLFLILISPTHYIFGKTELTIKHFFGLKEIIEYKDIRSIDEFTESGTRAWIRPLKNYYIAYPHKSKFPFQSEIRKSKKAKRLLEYYTNKEIE